MSNFELGPQEVIVVPVDGNDRTLLFSDIKIENVDSGYRTIFDPKGLTWKLAPGEYRVKIFLRTLQEKTAVLKVVPGTLVYRLQVETGKEQRQTVPPPANPAMVQEAEPVTSQQASKKQKEDDRIQPRYQITLPVAYRTTIGQWVSSKSLNLSTTGVCIESTGQVGEEDNLYVRLNVPISSIPIECPARVVWIKFKDVYRPCMGLQLFLTANMRSSLDNWLSLTKKP